MKKILLCAAAATTLAACNKTKTITCGDQNYILYTVGYTLAEVDTIELRWFDRSAGFTKPLDTFILRNRPDYGVSGDTILIPEQMFSGLPPKGGRPWTFRQNVEVYIPAANRSYRISDIETEGKTTMEVKKNAGGHAGCTNEITAYTLDGTRIQVGPPLIYLKK